MGKVAVAEAAAAVVPEVVRWTNKTEASRNLGEMERKGAIKINWF